PRSRRGRAGAPGSSPCRRTTSRRLLRPALYVVVLVRGQLHSSCPPRTTLRSESAAAAHWRRRWRWWRWHWRRSDRGGRRTTASAPGALGGEGQQQGG